MLLRSKLFVFFLLFPLPSLAQPTVTPVNGCVQTDVISNGVLGGADEVMTWAEPYVTGFGTNYAEYFAARTDNLAAPNSLGSREIGLGRPPRSQTIGNLVAAYFVSTYPGSSVSSIVVDSNGVPQSPWTNLDLSVVDFNLQRDFEFPEIIQVASKNSAGTRADSCFALPNLSQGTIIESCLTVADPFDAVFPANTVVGEIGTYRIQGTPIVFFGTGSELRASAYIGQGTLSEITLLQGGGIQVLATNQHGLLIALNGGVSFYSFAILAPIQISSAVSGTVIDGDLDDQTTRFAIAVSSGGSEEVYTGVVDVSASSATLEMVATGSNIQQVAVKGATAPFIAIQTGVEFSTPQPEIAALNCP